MYNLINEKGNTTNPQNRSKIFTWIFVFWLVIRFFLNYSLTGLFYFFPSRSKHMSNTLYVAYGLSTINSIQKKLKQVN